VKLSLQGGSIMKKLTTILFAIGVAASSSAFAGHPMHGGHPGVQHTHDVHHRQHLAQRDPAVNQRQHNERHRIQNGVRSGALTKDEAKGLAMQQKSIRQEERSYKSDGALTRSERKDLHQDLNAASRNIYQQKHDSETR
jgi:hypothetical protein